MKEEIWKNINGFENIYMISNLGNIKSLSRTIKGKNNSLRTISEKYLTPTNNGKGYLVVALYKNNKRYFKKIHILVAESFIPNINNKPQVNHKDGNKTNNKVSNLEWNTNKENCIHRQLNGLGNIEKATLAKMKPIQKIELKSKKILKEYSSVKEASIEMNCKIDSIARVARGLRKSYKGFGWKYI